jgi:hypothetical protein
MVSAPDILRFGRLATDLRPRHRFVARPVLAITAVNIGLLAGLLRRLGCTVWPIAFAIVVFALTEDSIFYFDSARPYA